MKQPEYFDKNQFEFHYNREERQKTLDPKIVNRQKAGFLKRNKHLVFILIDILVIAMVWMILTPLLKNIGEKYILGCSFKMESFQFDDKLMITIDIKIKDKNTDIPGSISARITDNNDNELKSVTDALTFGENKDHHYTRLTLDYIPGITDIFAKIIFGNEEFILKSKVKGI